MSLEDHTFAARFAASSRAEQNALVDEAYLKHFRDIDAMAQKRIAEETPVSKAMKRLDARNAELEKIEKAPAPKRARHEDVTTKSSAQEAAQRAIGVITAREAIDNGISTAVKAVETIPVLNEFARAGEDILQLGLNPFTWLATPVYAPYRLASAAVNAATGRKEPIRPGDLRLTVGNAPSLKKNVGIAVKKAQDSGLPILSQAAKLLNFLT